LQQAHGELQVTIDPGPNRHGSTGVVKALTAIPFENIGFAFLAIAG
jgi:hypothetical protein